MDVVTELRERAARVPADGATVVARARERALAAVEIVAAAVDVDPTLPEADRCRRDVDLFAELLRQITPLGRQAEIELQRRRLVAEGAAERQVARLGRTNPRAPVEVEALGKRAVEIAERIAAGAWPDWNTPARIHERSVNLLPAEHELEQIADWLRRAVQPSLRMAHPAAEAVRLAVLADRINPSRGRRVCAGPGCDRELEPASTRRRRYCGATCRQRARRLTRRTPATNEEVLGQRECTRPTADLDALLADLPADTRPVPPVAPYDDLLRRPTSTPTPAPLPAQTGHDWCDTDVCLWRDEGRWGLTGPDGRIEVPEFGPFGNSLAASATTAAQAAADAVITALTGRAVTGWDQDESSRSVYGPASWYACLTTPPSGRSGPGTDRGRSSGG